MTVDVRVAETSIEELDRAHGECLPAPGSWLVNGDPSADPGVLLQAADIAMYQAKAAGRNRFQVSDGKLEALAGGM